MSLLLQIISTEKEWDLGDVVKERESRTNLSNQSAFLYSPQPSNILLSLSLSLSLSVPNTPRCSLSLSMLCSPTTSACLSFFLCSFTRWHKCRRFQIQTGQIEGWRKGWNPLFQNETKIKERSDLLGQSKAWGSDCSAGFVFSLFSLKSSVHKHCTVLHVRTSSSPPSEGPQNS